MAWLTPEEEAMYKSTPGLEYKMANLVNAQSVAKTFEIGDGKQFDIVIDLASTAEYGKDKETYQQRVIDIVKVCGEEAKKRGIKKWIEVSTSQVYKPESAPSDENAKLKPWTALAAAKLEAEEIVKTLGIPYVIIRPAIIYGPGDIGGITPRLVCGAVYKKLDKEMLFLWKGELQINTVHVVDVARAIWFLVSNGKEGEVYNLADQGRTDQQTVNQCISEIFGIKTGFYNRFISGMARLNFQGAVSASNEQHMQPWGEITQEHNITKTPLSPFLEPEILYDNDTSINGTKITTLGFQYQYPKLTKDLLVESLNYWVSINAFPPL
jgi:nucleoside-diphosphate-sugar epimerase